MSYGLNSLKGLYRGLCREVFKTIAHIGFLAQGLGFGASDSGLPDHGLNLGSRVYNKSTSLQEITASKLPVAIAQHHSQRSWRCRGLHTTYITN